MSKQSITAWIDDIHTLSKVKGWWDGTEGRDPTADEINSKIMLIVSELAEAVERVRSPDFDPREFWYEANGKPDGFGVELADAAIRLFDLCGKLRVPLEAHIDAKDSYNATRPHRHGGKRA